MEQDDATASFCGSKLTGTSYRDRVDMMVAALLNWDKHEPAIVKRAISLVDEIDEELAKRGLGMTDYPLCTNSENVNQRVVIDGLSVGKNIRKIPVMIGPGIECNPLPRYDRVISVDVYGSSSTRQQSAAIRQSRLPQIPESAGSTQSATSTRTILTLAARSRRRLFLAMMAQSQ